MDAIYYTLSVTWKELQMIVKERAWLVILFLLPLMIGGFFGAGNLVMAQPGEDVIQLEVGLVNQDQGTFGTEIAKVLRSIEVLQVTDFGTVSEAEQLVAKGDSAAVIVIPADFSQKIDGYEPTTLTVIVDPAEPEAANIVTGIAKQVAGEFMIWGEVQYGVRTVFEEGGILAVASPEEARAIEAQNLGVVMTRINEMRTNPVIEVIVEDASGEASGPGLQTFFAYLFPGLTVMFIYFIISMSASTLLSERENGTLRRLLTATIPKGAILAGKMLAYMLLACMQVVVMFTVARMIFGTPLGRSPLGLVTVTLVVAFNATALGMMVAALVKSAKQADTVGVILAFVLAGLGGALAISATPLSRQGGAMGAIASFIPHSYAVEGYYRLMAENSGFVQILPQAAVLLGMGVIFFLVALWRFRFDK